MHYRCNNSSIIDVFGNFWRRAAPLQCQSCVIIIKLIIQDLGKKCLHTPNLQSVHVIAVPKVGMTIDLYDNRLTLHCVPCYNLLTLWRLVKRSLLLWLYNTLHMTFATWVSILFQTLSDTLKTPWKKHLISKSNTLTLVICSHIVFTRLQFITNIKSRNASKMFLYSLKKSF